LLPLHAGLPCVHDQTQDFATGVANEAAVLSLWVVFCVCGCAIHVFAEANAGRVVR